MAELVNPRAVVHCNMTYDAKGDWALIEQHLKANGPGTGRGDGIGPALTKQRMAAAVEHIKGQAETMRCIEQIRRLDNDDTAFQEMINQPLLHAAGSTPRPGQAALFDLQRVANDIRAVMDKTELPALLAAGRPCPAQVPGEDEVPSPYAVEEQYRRQAQEEWEERGAEEEGGAEAEAEAEVEVAGGDEGEGESGQGEGEGTGKGG